MDLRWFERLDYQIYVNPRTLNEDCEYFPALKNRFSEIIKNLSESMAPVSFIRQIRSYMDVLESVIVQYYSGNIIKAQSSVNSMIKELIESSDIAAANVSECRAFQGYGNASANEIQFFRARSSEEYMNFSSGDMLHIPFSKRSLIRSERFSIPGLPCMYLGNTSYDCWIETGYPDDHVFNVSAVRLDNTQKVFDLAVSFFWIQEEIMKNGYEYDEGSFTDLFRLLILSVSTSYVVSEKNRYFKSEYILSQLIMLACKDYGLDGVVYLSKRVKFESIAIVYAVNLALFAVYNEDGDWSKRIMEHSQVGNSVNFGLYKKLSPSIKEKKYDLRISYSDIVRNITLNDNCRMQVPYCETDFYGFDNFLYCNFDNCLM